LMKISVKAIADDPGQLGIGHDFARKVDARCSLNPAPSGPGHSLAVP
jgi:hypothetical protein